MTHSAVARSSNAPRHLRPADDPIAQLNARSDALALRVEHIATEHVTRMDLLAQHVALLVAEKNELLRLCDLLAQLVAPVVDEHTQRCAAELAPAVREVDVSTVPTAPAFTALDRELLPVNPTLPPDGRWKCLLCGNINAHEHDRCGCYRPQARRAS